MRLKYTKSELNGREVLKHTVEEEVVQAQLLQKFINFTQNGVLKTSLDLGFMVHDNNYCCLRL